jgi:hypothetical protein
VGVYVRGSQAWRLRLAEQSAVTKTPVALLSADLRAILAHAARTEKGGEVSSAVSIDEITGADSELFGVSVCTVDGQVSNSFHNSSLQL